MSSSSSTAVPMAGMVAPMGSMQLQLDPAAAVASHPHALQVPGGALAPGGAMAAAGGMQPQFHTPDVAAVPMTEQQRTVFAMRQAVQQRDHEQVLKQQQHAHAQHQMQLHQHQQAQAHHMQMQLHPYGAAGHLLPSHSAPPGAGAAGPTQINIKVENTSQTNTKNEVVNATKNEIKTEPQGQGQGNGSALATQSSPLADALTRIWRDCRRWLADPMNRFMLFATAVPICSVLWQRQQHQWRMSQEQLRIDGNPVLKAFQVFGARFQ